MDCIRVLHVLANSHPDTNGYAIRSHMILKHQNQTDDIEVFAITSPFYPSRISMSTSVEHDGITYVRCKHPLFRKGKLSYSLRLIRKLTKPRPQNDSNDLSEKNLIKKAFDFIYYGLFKCGRLLKKPFQIPYRVWEEKVLMKDFESQIYEFINQQNIDVVHAHTPYRVGIPALNAAKKSGKLFVYEMRGLWEETAVANGRWKRKGPAYLRFRRLESKVLKGADKIVAISNELREEIISRKIPANKISIVPNGIELSDSNIASSSFEQIKNELDHLQGDLTIGYIGSLRRLEGVDQTVTAVSKLVERGHDVKFFCLTGNNGQEDLRRYAKTIGLENRALITGPVPHLEINQYYDLIDIFVVSRPDFPVTRMVTPLKPFEAMARSLPVVVTNLPALTEIVSSTETGIVTEDNKLSSLVNSIENLIINSELRNQLGEQARTWVETERSWDKLVQKYTAVYSD